MYNLYTKSIHNISSVKLYTISIPFCCNNYHGQLYTFCTLCIVYFLYTLWSVYFGEIVPTWSILLLYKKYTPWASRDPWKTYKKYTAWVYFLYKGRYTKSILIFCKGRHQAFWRELLAPKCITHCNWLTFSAYVSAAWVEDFRWPETAKAFASSLSIGAVVILALNFLYCWPWKWRPVAFLRKHILPGQEMKFQAVNVSKSSLDIFTVLASNVMEEQLTEKQSFDILRMWIFQNQPFNLLPP